MCRRKMERGNSTKTIICERGVDSCLLKYLFGSGKVKFDQMCCFHVEAQEMRRRQNDGPIRNQSYVHKYHTMDFKWEWIQKYIVMNMEAKHTFTTFNRDTWTIFVWQHPATSTSTNWILYQVFLETRLSTWSKITGRAASGITYWDWDYSLHPWGFTAIFELFI